MRTVTKWFIALIATPVMLVGFFYEFIQEGFHSGQMWYARFMENLIDWVEGD